MDFLTDYLDVSINDTIGGLTDELSVFVVLNYFHNSKKNTLVLTNSLYEANNLYKKFKTYTTDVLLFPMDDFITSVALAVSPELKMTRLETLNSLDTPKIIVTNLMGYLHYLPTISSQKEYKIVVNGELKRNEIIKVLDNYGYKKTSIVTSTGEYALRGFIIDLYPFEANTPVRIEFFGEDVESIRSFDEESQRSKDSLKEVTILPVDEVSDDNPNSIVDYCKNPTIFKINNQQIKAAYLNLQEEILEYATNNDENNKKYMFELKDIKEKDVIYLNTLNTNDKEKNLNAKAIDSYNNDFDLLKQNIDKYLLEKKKVFICSTNKSLVKMLKGIIPEVKYIDKEINNGFIIKDIVIISDHDIVGRSSNVINYHNNYRLGRKIKDYDQLNVGDYVVHSMHGIGIYAGLITLERNGIKKDYIQINYYGNDKIYVPASNIGNVYKYSANEDAHPQINKLNSISWEKKKRSITKRIKDISEELIKLYSARNAITKEKYKTYEEELLFANTFSYNETPDQLRAIAEIDHDLISTRPMDRLLCGDVGFGKTEVAFRAMFKAVLNNKQVLYLCPTTILSKQQYENALERFKDYPIEIALLNRFTTPKEKNRIIDGLSKGTIDIVFGTHRLLSDDVKFNKLGLMIVDEEQRFGVLHKEKIKEYKNDINVLTLSATPIPRTLKMALSGLRDLSVIDTPPVNRYPIQTYVLAENDMVIKDAIYKELSRNGQIFILFNNISKMESKLNHLNKLVPEAKIVAAHGQMSKTELENIMDDFIEHKFDILLCTTIIETGIDIANTNTLIVYDADHFGLSQLYQLRGRVGRSNRIAYAYLFYDNRKVLNDLAVKRLQAIKEFTELGSGYKIAMRDLAIRGAGDILGSEQAGFVDTVGISLYLKMLEDEMKRQRGEEVYEEDESNSLLNVETHVKDSYVSDEDLKIEIHQKINEIDSYDKLLEIKAELEDRFGKVDEELIIYMYEEWFEKLAKKLNIKNVKQDDRFVSIELPEELSSSIKGDKLFLEAYSITPKFQFKYFNKRIVINLPIKQVDKHFIYYIVELLNKI